MFRSLRQFDARGRNRLKAARMKQQFARLCAFALLVTSAAWASLDQFPAPGSPCVITGDQADSFFVRVRHFPIKVIVDSEFSGGQREEIAKALESWNELGRRSLGFELFAAPEIEGLPGVATAREYCKQDKERIQPGLLIAREDSPRRWRELKVGDDARGVTRRCLMGDATNETRQLVVINTAETDSRQVRGVVLHELGHVLGLNHSCAGPKSAGAAFRACDGLKTSHPYREAVMYPSFTPIGHGSFFDFRDELRANDIERAYCLYFRRRI
jgi:hypothetical protein